MAINATTVLVQIEEFVYPSCRSINVSVTMTTLAPIVVSRVLSHMLVIYHNKQFSISVYSCAGPDTGAIQRRLETSDFVIWVVQIRQ